jgi:predicted anti-sigma-YlaC factor YlaD
MTQQEMTTRHVIRHLTEDELEEVLLGLDCSESEGHLAECAVCRGKIEEFRGSLELFNHASMAWSEAKSNSMNRDLAEHRTPFRMSVRALWTCASLLVVVLAGVIGLGEHRHTSAEAGTPSRAGAVVESPADAASEIASDNAMLRQIDSAINAPEPSPAQLYGRTSTPDAESEYHVASVRN